MCFQIKDHCSRIQNKWKEVAKATVTSAYSLTGSASDKKKAVKWLLESFVYKEIHLEGHGKQVSHHIIPLESNSHAMMLGQTLAPLCYHESSTSMCF